QWAHANPVMLVHSATAPRTATLDQVTDRAVGSGNEHAIKFAEVAQESHRRGNPHALPAAARACHLIAGD
ncbi:MAG: hypothetical protein M3Y49_18335, partial [Actinomycetota bacterium]|nr:hypothetical protein [Actinomycetota bacterium]